jgi:hypothetical protein
MEYSGNKPTGGLQFGQIAGASQSTAQQTGFGASSTTPQIDVAHIRSTTKFDHLQQLLQEEIQRLDNAILNQQNDCDKQLAEVLPSVQESGSQLGPAAEFLTSKVEELEHGLENDAEAIMLLMNSELKQDEGEAKCVFRNIDRMKVPRHYQLTGSVMDASGGASLLGTSAPNSTGLTGWWNQPQTLRGVRSSSGLGGQHMQLVNEDIDDGSKHGPKTLVELIDSRAEEFKKVNVEQKALLSDIEDFIDGLEEKVMMKQRELNDRLNYGNADAASRKEEQRQRNLNQLGFVFGEVQRGLYEMADKVGVTRDGIVELGMLR